MNLIKELYIYLGRRRLVRSSRMITKMLFGFFPKPKNSRILWDFTTIILRKGLSKWVSHGDSVLEIGTGDVGLLSIFLSKIKKNCRITAVDINPKFVENAKVNARKEGLDIQIFQSDLFSKIPDKFDLIFFNPPYVPSDRLDLKRAKEYHGFKDTSFAVQTSDGGKDGLNVVNRYLKDGKTHLNPKGYLLLGINLFYVNAQHVIGLINEFKYKIVERINSKYTECTVFALTLEKGK